MRFVESPKSIAVTNAGVVIAIEPRDAKALVVRDLQRGAELSKLPYAAEASLSPDGEAAALALSKPAGDIAFHRTRDGVLAATVHVNLPQNQAKTARGRLFMESSRINEMLWSGDGKRLVVGVSKGGPAYVIDPATPKLLQTIAQKGQLVAIDATAARGLFVELKYEFLMSDIKAVSVVDLAKGSVLRRIELKPPTPATIALDADPTVELSHATFGLSADGKKIFAYEYGDLYAIDVATAKRDKLLEHQARSGLGLFGSLGSFGSLGGSRHPLMVSPDGSSVVLSRDGGHVAVNLTDFTERNLGDGSPRAFSPDSQVIASTNEHVAFVSGAQLDVPEGHEEPVKALAFVAQGNVLASGGGSLRMWDSRSCRPLRHTESQGDITRLAASSDGGRLVVLGSKLRVVGSGGRVQTLDLHEQLTAMAISRDGANIALGTKHYEKGASLRVLHKSGPDTNAASPTTVESLAFTPDGASLAVLTDKTWSDEKDSKESLTIRNAATLEVEATLPEELAEGGSSVQFGESKDVLLVGRAHRGAWLYDAKRSAVVRRFGHEACCKAIAVSPDGTLMAGTSGSDIVVWETGTRKLRGIAHGHSDDVLAIAFSPDGSRIASGSEDTTVLLWDVAQLRKPEPPFRLRELANVPSVRSLARSDHAGWYVSAQGRIASVNDPPRGKLPDPGKVRQVASASLSHCALLESGKVSCWGYTRGGALGTPEQIVNKRIVDRDQPMEVPGVSDAVSISGGNLYNCALASKGAVWCWGTLSPGFAKAGEPALNAQTIAPHAIAGIGPASSISVGEAHACAATVSGQVFCWGLGSSGQLGGGLRSSSLSPVSVQGIGDATSISCGDEHCCAVRRDGTVWCWGANEHDELGSGGGVVSAVPAPVPGVEQAVEVGTKDRFTCARSSGGTVTCWGRSWYAHASFSEPTAIPALAGASALDVKSSTVCADIDRKVKCLE
jgi:alpha-tubulin suppressor-like RCC1 family protein/WD40 repeat protein